MRENEGHAHHAEVNVKHAMLYECVLSTLPDTTQLCLVNTVSLTSLLSPPMDVKNHAVLAVLHSLIVDNYITLCSYHYVDVRYCTASHGMNSLLRAD